MEKGKAYWGNIEKIDDNRWLIPQDKALGMRVKGIIYASEAMLQEIREGGAMTQVVNVATLPGIVKASLAMPDIHWGYGFCIGGVAATAISEGGVVSPGGVGYDINCGVRLLRSEIEVEALRPRLHLLMDALFASIPAGVGTEGSYPFSKQELQLVLSEGMSFLYKQGLAEQHDLECTESKGSLSQADPAAVSPQACKRGTNQCGTLGAGNHFVEVQAIEQIFDQQAAKAMGLAVGKVTFMIHSGSRALGHQVCQDYLKKLRQAPQKYGISLVDRQLVCAPVTSAEGQQYLGAMAAAANFAWCNRQLLAMQIRRVVEKFFNQSRAALGLRQVYDVAHNMAKIETHQLEGKKIKLCVHRKGATRAFPPEHPELPAAYRHIGQPVIIPGDMGRASYVLVGTEEAMKETFGSTCHGAGRLLSRTQALKANKGQHVAEELLKQGILTRTRTLKGLAEEQPQAYKDIDQVIHCVSQVGISRKVARLRPLGVIKG
jgi:tRNA-splicing ligase RtcB